jgi:hypothetical protein
MKDLVLQQVKSLENIISNLDHVLGSDELSDLQYHLDMIKKLQK